MFVCFCFRVPTLQLYAENNKKKARLNFMNMKGWEAFVTIPNFT